MTFQFLYDGSDTYTVSFRDGKLRAGEKMRRGVFKADLNWLAVGSYRWVVNVPDLRVDSGEEFG